MTDKDNMSPRTRTFSNEEVLEQIRRAPDPFVTAGELADHFDKENATLLDRLNELEDDGKVTSRHVGARAKVWWIPDD